MALTRPNAAAAIRGADITFEPGPPQLAPRHSLSLRAFVAARESVVGPSRQIPMRGLCVRFQGIAEADRRALSAGGDADDPYETL
jgi:hypothetical protein